MTNKTRKHKTRKHKTIQYKTKKNRVFKESDYNSGDGMLTSTWGPAMWHYLHTMSFNYPPDPTKEDKKNYRNFILSLQHVLPCKYCRMNLKTNFKSLPLKQSDMKCRETFSRYIYELHELVNRMLKKKSNLTYDDVRERYEHFRSRCTVETPVIFKVEKNKTRRNKKEKGCTEPLYGHKAKCVLRIVPQTTNIPSLEVDNKCVKYKIDNDKNGSTSGNATSENAELS